MKRIRNTICLSLFLSSLTYAQITIDSSLVDFTLQLSENGVIHSLSLRKNRDSLVYSNLKYSRIPQSEIVGKKVRLADEIGFLHLLWDTASRLKKINIEGISIDYVLAFDDITRNQALAFSTSPEWKAHIKKNGKKIDIELLHKIMLNHKVYSPLDSLVSSYGYSISRIGTEKHGFMTNEELKKIGYSGKEIIPVPYIVWLALTKK